MKARGSLGLAATALASFAHGAVAQNSPAPVSVPAPAQQIAAAVLPLPDSQRAGARVLGYDPSLRLVQLRPGGNGMTCLADDPREPRFHVACYHDALEPFMARGRELRSQGRRDSAVDSIRHAEIRAGSLQMPNAASLASLTGPAGSWDPATGQVTGARPLHVIYLPFATEATTGLPARPRRGAPWLMHPGLPSAHVMYVPEP